MNKIDNSATNALETRLLSKIAWMYYVDNLTQKKIGDQLGLSRIKVNRMLQQARNLGIVEIKIHTPSETYFEIENALRCKYNLKDAIVVTDAEDGEALYLALAQGASNWLQKNISEGMTIGVGQGRTLSYLPQVFVSEDSCKCTWAEIVGGAGDTPGKSFTNYNITSRMALLSKGLASYIYAPTIVSSQEIRNALYKEPAIANALDVARNADIVLHSLGPIDKSAILYLHGYLTDSDLGQLRELGAVGDTLSQFFDSAGNCVPHPICRRVVGLTLEELRKIPFSVVVAGGREKIDVIRVAARSGILNVLVTDFYTANALLEGD